MSFSSSNGMHISSYYSMRSWGRNGIDTPYLPIFLFNVSSLTILKISAPGFCFYVASYENSGSDWSSVASWSPELLILLSFCFISRNTEFKGLHFMRNVSHMISFIYMWKHKWLSKISSFEIYTVKLLKWRRLFSQIYHNLKTYILLEPSSTKE